MNIEQELLDLKARIIQNYKTKGIIASGRFEREAEVRQLSDKRWQLLGTPYTHTFEHGRRPGKVPAGFRFIIEQWSKDKGLHFDSEADRKRFSYFVAKRIREQGTNLFIEGGREDIYTPEINTTIENIKQKIFADIVERLK